MIYKLFYVSNASDMFKGKDDIDKILTVAHSFNAEKNITGILLYHSGIFLQLLEGEKSDVDALYEKISLDSRHKNVIKLFSIEDKNRIFKDWSMAYRDITELDIKMVNEILSWNKLVSAARDIDNNLIIHILERFKKYL